MEQKIKFKKEYKIELAKTLSGHYYGVWEKKGRKEKFLGYFVSVTTFLNAYPTSEYLTKWIADRGFHESRQIRDEAGRKGTKIHLALQDLIEGKELYEANYLTEEWVKINSFVNWYHEYKPEIIAIELKIFSPKNKYCGTIDCIAKISEKIYVIDWKSSQSIHPSFSLQCSAYSQALEEISNLKVDETAVLQLGAKNKQNYRFVIYPDWRDHFKIFMNVKATWEYDNGVDKDFEPPVLILPETLKL